ncbi:WD40 repeat-like protein [Serendipita vermifera]|nr:WD40 repeat-like protein [Serendipita vermifera]
MSSTQSNNPFRQLDSALAVANLANDTLAVASVPSPIKDAAAILITVLETIREVKSNKEAWAQFGTRLSDQINDIQTNLAGCPPPHSTALLLMANRYQVKLNNILTKVRAASSRNLFDRHLNRRTDKEEITQLMSDMDSCWKDFILEMSTKTHEAVNRIEKAVNRTEEGLNHLLYTNYIEKLEVLKDSGWDVHRACLPGTRIRVLNAINAWMNQPSSDQVLWLTDVAGSGKSTIARHLAEQWRASGLLGGFFFFNKNIMDATNIRLFCSTIAAQLAHHPQYQSQLQPSIVNGVKKLVPTPPFKDKLLKLVIEPSKGFKLVFIVDALDECNEHDRGTLLDGLLCLIKQSPPLKLFITSRPELDIERRLHKYRSQTDNLHHPELESNRADIRMFVSDQMKELVLDHILDSRQVELLCQHVNCLFILASTACRAICNHPDPAATLQMLLDSRNNALTNLNKLYLKILENACRLEELDERSWRAIHAKMMQILKVIVSAAIPLTAHCIDAILGIKGTEHVVKSLASVLSLGGDKTVFLLHPTFREFLVDREVAGQFYIDMAEANRLMAKGCLNVMKSELKFNICGLESSFLLNKQIDDLEDQISRSISKQLQYSSVYWPNHVINSGEPSQNQQVTEAILQICKSPYPFYWMEVLSVLQEVPNGISGLQDVKDWLQDLSAKEIAYDIRQFLLLFSTPIADSLPHIYLSALPFSPVKSLLHQEGHKIFPNVLSVILGCSEMWPEPPQVWQGHTGGVLSVAFSPDGRQIASGSSDYTIRLWDSKTGQQTGEPLQGHTLSVYSVAFSPDGQQIASGSVDKTIRRWDAKTTQPIGEPLQGHTGFVFSVAFSPDGQRIVSGSTDKMIQLWDAKTGQPIGEPLQGHTSSVLSVAFSPDGQQIASGSDDKTIRLWDAKTGQPIIEPLQGHTEAVWSVAFSPDSQQIVSGSNDKTIRLWDAKTGQPIGEPLQGHTGSVFSVAFSPDGQQISAGSDGMTLQLWDAKTGQQTGEQLRGHAHWVKSVAFSPDSQQIVSGSNDKTIQLWNAKTGQPIGASVQGHTDSVLSVVVSPDGQQIASGSVDKTIQIWDAKTGQPIGEPLQGHTDSVSSVAFSPDGQQIVSGSDDMTLQLWDAKTGQPIGEPLQGHTGSVSSVAFSPDGWKIVSGSVDRTIRLWDAKTGRQISEPLQGHTDSVSSVAFSPDGQQVVSGSEDMTIRLWDSQTGQPIGEPLQGHTWSVSSVAFSPDGQQIASGSHGKTIRIWDAKTGQQIGEPLQGHNDSVLSVAFSPDSQRIVSGSHDKTIRLWDAKTGQPIGEPLQGHTQSVYSVTFSLDGRQVVSGSQDCTIMLSNVENNQAFSGPHRAYEPTIPSSTMAHHSISPSYTEFQEILSQVHPNPYGPHFSVPGFDNCTLSQDGWVKASDKLLYWVPPSNRHGLQHPYILSIPTTGPHCATWIDFSCFQCGPNWTKGQGS